nr:unnamed protein product [Digitaria exilis]
MASPGAASWHQSVHEHVDPEDSEPSVSSSSAGSLTFSSSSSSSTGSGEAAAAARRAQLWKVSSRTAKRASASARYSGRAPPPPWHSASATRSDRRKSVLALISATSRLSALGPLCLVDDSASPRQALSSSSFRSGTVLTRRPCVVAGGGMSIGLERDGNGNAAIEQCGRGSGGRFLLWLCERPRVRF